MNARRYERFAALRITVTRIAGCLVAGALMSADSIAAPPVSLDAKAIGQASGATATAAPDGVVKIGWPRTDVTVTVDGVTALHNHFFHDTPKVYFMHIGGEGRAETLAAGVKAVWGAIRAVRSTHAQPATSFGGATPAPGRIDADAVSKIVGQPATDSQGVAKVTIGRTGTMQGMVVGASMGLTTWAAFSGSDALAAMDGDFIMSAEEVQPVL